MMARRKAKTMSLKDRLIRAAHGGRPVTKKGVRKIEGWCGIYMGGA